MIITAPKLLTLQHGMKPINSGAVVFSRGIILAAGPALDVLKKYPAHRVYSFRNAVLMPGLINLHSHLELPALLNSIRAETFPEWVLNLIAAKKNLVSNEYRKAASRNVQTLLETGTTTIGEICTHNASPDPLKLSGLRAVLYHEIISMNPFSKMPLPSASPRSLSYLIRAGISPHAPHTVSELILRHLGKIAQRKKLPLCMHVAESKDEIMLLRGIKSGFEKLYRAVGWDLSWAPCADSPFAYLQRLGLLSSDFLGVHAVQTNDEDLRILKKAGASIAHCPRSNKETGVGRMPLKKFLDAGITVGLGTDSLASSPSLNMWDEMRYAHQIHRRSGVSAEDIFRLATIGGAKALGLDKKIGTLEPDKKADLIAVPLPQKDTGNLYSDLLRETKSCIMSVVDGKLLYKEDA